MRIWKTTDHGDRTARAEDEVVEVAKAPSSKSAIPFEPCKFCAPLQFAHELTLLESMR